MPGPLTLALLSLAAVAAGFVDAVVGGGGLVTVPALMLGLSKATPVTTILGTNKAVSCTGTTFAAAHFVRARAVSPREMIGPVLAAMAGSALGVLIASFFQGRFDAYLRPLMLGLMVAMLAFTLLRPRLGTTHAPRFGLAHQRALAFGVAFVLGTYDGFFGPGTGSVLIFLFVTLLGFDFLRASALAKSVNWASNVGALLVFVSRGSWLPWVALFMAVGNAIGGTLGARAAIARGAAWVRVVFVAVVSALILSLAWKIWGGWR